MATHKPNDFIFDEDFDVILNVLDEDELFQNTITDTTQNVSLVHIFFSFNTEENWQVLMLKVRC